MGWNFRRRITLLPGIRLNIGKTGASVSFGVRGLRSTIGKRGATTTVGVPGSGLSYTARANATATGADPEAFKRRLLEEKRQLEESPARLAFYQRKRDEHLKSLGQSPEPGPLVCTACKYERKPFDPGPLNICPKCKYDLSGERTKRAAKTSQVGYQLGLRWRQLLLLGAVVLVALVTYVVVR